MVYMLEKPLYHGTSAAAAVFILGNSGMHGFVTPIYLTQNKQSAIHYAKAATAYLEGLGKEEGHKLICEGWAVFTFCSVPNELSLVPDDYNPQAEPEQYKYTGVAGRTHFSVEYGTLEVTEEEHLRLECFAIGMWRK